MAKKNLNSFNTKTALEVGGKTYQYHSLPKFAESSGCNLDSLPYSLKILLENLLRQEDGEIVEKDDAVAIAQWDAKAKPSREIQYMPARILLQDFTGVPAVADLAAMRSAMKDLGGDPNKINPHQPADLVIDHSVQIDSYGSADSAQKNTEKEFERNKERYEFLKWGQTAFHNFRVVPPSTGIVHQINLEYLAHVAMVGEKEGETWVYPDTLVGTDSHTTMINGLGVLGWGVGGIEAEAAMLGQPSSMLIPNVVGFKLNGQLPTGTTATDLVLTVTQMLRAKGVVGKFVEFYGPGLANLSLADRATIANMAPEYGATMGIFPVDEKTTEYLTLTGREDKVPLVEAYFKAQGLWFDSSKTPTYSDSLELDMGQVQPSLAGPSRPQDRRTLSEVRGSFREQLVDFLERQEKLSKPKSELAGWIKDQEARVEIAPEISDAHPDTAVDSGIAHREAVSGTDYHLTHGSVVIASITSCTNTSNPSVLMAAGLLAKKAVEKGLKVKPWVKTSLAPGSLVVTDYLKNAGLLPDLESLGFHVVGYGCTTCIGNSGPLDDPIIEATTKGDLATASVLSGNRNFEGRVNPHVRANYLASPPLVVAYALAGNIHMDLSKDPLGHTDSGEAIYLKDVWPSAEEVEALVQKNITSAEFKKSYSDVFAGSSEWKAIPSSGGDLYDWQDSSTYIQEPPFFKNMPKEPTPLQDIKGAKMLAFLGDSVTTDHISPAGAFPKDGPAGKYLVGKGVEPKNFNSFGSRRGNHDIMIRGTFANIRIRNRLAPGTEGGFTNYFPKDEVMPIYDAAQAYEQDGTPLIVVAGKEYGTGSSRDWAAKGTRLLGVKAVLTESFERIHRSNLIGMGVLPLQFADGESAEKHGWDGTETFDIEGMDQLKPGQTIDIKVKKSDGAESTIKAVCRIDTPNELEYVRHGGILQYVLRQGLES